MTDEAGFPVPPPEGAEPTKAKRPAKGSEEAKAWGRAMQAARQRKRDAGPAPSRARTTKGATATPEPTTAPTLTLPEIESSIVEGFTKLGGMLTPVAPIPGTYLLMTAEDIGGTLTRLAAKNPALLRALNSTSAIMDYVALGTWVVGMYVAVSVQSGRIPADAPSARNFGLYDVAREFYPDMATAPPAHTDPTPSGAGGAFDPFAVPVPPDVREAEARASVG